MGLFYRIGVTSAILVLMFYSLSAAEKLSLGAKFAVAIERGELDTVKALVEGGAKPDTWIDYGEGHKITPLMKACGEGKADIAEYLLDKGANINAADEMGLTSLFNAVTQGDVELTEMLLKRGAKANIKDFRKFTPLMLAASAGDEKLIEVLVKGGADLKAEGHGLTPLTFAISSGKIEAVSLLVKLGAPVNLASKEGDPGTTALFYAIDSGNPEMVRTLIGLKANVNVRTKSGNTPLKQARRGDQTEVIAILKEAGAKK